MFSIYLRLCLALCLSTFVTSQMFIQDLMMAGGAPGFTAKYNFDKYSSNLFLIDLQCDFSFVSQPRHGDRDFEGLTFLHNKTISTNGYDDNMKQAIGYNVDLVFQRSGNKLNNVLLYRVLGKVGKNDVISLSYNSLNDKHSFINVLYANQTIENKIFLLELYPTDGQITFGAIPRNKQSSYINREIISHVKYNKWGVILNNIYFNHTLFYKTTSYARISSHDTRVFIPHEMYSLITSIVFGTLINNNHCQLHDLYDNSSYIRCYCTSIMDLPEFYFGIKDTSTFRGKYFYVNMSIYDLFWEYDGFCTFLMEKNMNDENGFEFGSMFLMKFATIFDFENKLIQFNPKFNKDVLNVTEIKTIVDYLIEDNDYGNIKFHLVNLTSVLLFIISIVLFILTKNTCK